MSDLYHPTHHFPRTLNRLTEKYDDAGEQMVDFLKRHARGENPDPDEFMKLLHLRALASDAMQAQYTVFKKPLKTVLNETK